MTKFEALEQIAADAGLTVDYGNLESADALIYDKTILLRKGMDFQQKYYCLAEEVGHYFVGGGNSVETNDRLLIGKCERRARRKAVEMMLDKKAVYDLLKSGYQNHEIAEQLEVPEQLLRDAYQVWGWIS